MPTSAQAQGSHIYAISFTPREAIQHTVDLKFNSEHLPGRFITKKIHRKSFFFKFLEGGAKFILAFNLRLTYFTYFTNNILTIATDIA